MDKQFNLQLKVTNIFNQMFSEFKRTKKSGTYGKVILYCYPILTALDSHMEFLLKLIKKEKDISKQLLKDSKIFIMSSDKDFIQLVDDRIAVWSPTKKKLYFKGDVAEDYKIPPHNYLMYRTLI